MQRINLKRGDRFITREGPFGTRVQDYFVANLSVLGEGMIINAVTANMSSNVVAQEYELAIPSWSAGYYELVLDVTGRWTITWPEKKGGPDLLEAVEAPIHCVICDGVRSIGWIHGEPACSGCRSKLLSERICDCAPYGEHIPVFCDRCGAAHSTKNIQSIGVRTVHPIYDDSCSCRSGWFFHDCRSRLFVKGSFAEEKFVPWADKYEEGRKDGRR